MQVAMYVRPPATALSFPRGYRPNIVIKNDRLENQEYFIGSLVLVGEDKSTEFKIVDGQQRLTTITLLLTALVDSFVEIKRDDLAKGLYSFIEGRDVSNKQFFKLENENPKPFLQNSIQNFKKDRSHRIAAHQLLLQLHHFLAIAGEKLRKALEVIIPAHQRLPKSSTQGGKRPKIKLTNSPPSFSFVLPSYIILFFKGKWCFADGRLIYPGGETGCVGATQSQAGSLCHCAPARSNPEP